MLEIITAGGWLMLPILTCSVVAMAIVVERFWSLRKNHILPANVLNQSCHLLRDHEISDADIEHLYLHSTLGQVLATGVANRHKPLEAIKISMQETGSHVAHEMNRFLNALGTIATITPLLGLLGTVLGMISVFTRITSAGVGNAGELAGGISQALITTAAGLAVAIPSLVMHRYFRGHIEKLLIDLEQQALVLVDTIDALANQRNAMQAARTAPAKPASAQSRQRKSALRSTPVEVV